ncbi:MAG: hypothetical protein P8Y76_00875 [bacterium]
MSDTTAPTSRSRRVLDGLYYLTAVFFFVYLLVYYWTARSGRSCSPSPWSRSRSSSTRWSRCARRRSTRGFQLP